jgi:hypothetical protein
LHSSHRKRSFFPVIAAKFRLPDSRRKFFNYNVSIKPCHISVGGESAYNGEPGGLAEVMAFRVWFSMSG